MRLYIIVPRGSERWYYTLLPCGNSFQKIVVEDVVVFNIYKYHDHRYRFDAFFYVSKRIYSGFFYNTKSKLHGAIQKLLQEELYVDVQ